MLGDRRGDVHGDSWGNRLGDCRGDVPDDWSVNRLGGKRLGS